jgi:hypothetical protein
MMRGQLIRLGGATAGIWYKQRFYCNSKISESYEESEAKEISEIEFDDEKSGFLLACSDVILKFGEGKAGLAFFYATKKVALYDPEITETNFTFTETQNGLMRTGTNETFFLIRQVKLRHILPVMVEKIVRQFFNLGCKNQRQLPSLDVLVFGVGERAFGFRWEDKFYSFSFFENAKICNETELFVEGETETRGAKTYFSYPWYEFKYDELGVKTADRMMGQYRWLFTTKNQSSVAIAHFDDEKKIVSFPRIWQEKSRVRLVGFAGDSFHFDVLRRWPYVRQSYVGKLPKLQCLHWLEKSLDLIEPEKFDPYNFEFIRSKPMKICKMFLRIFSYSKKPYDKCESREILRNFHWQDLFWLKNGCLVNRMGGKLQEALCICLSTPKELSEQMQNILQEHMCTDIIGLTESFLCDGFARELARKLDNWRGDRSDKLLHWLSLTIGTGSGEVAAGILESIL